MNPSLFDFIPRLVHNYELDKTTAIEHSCCCLTHFFEVTEIVQIRFDEHDLGC